MMMMVCPMGQDLYCCCLSNECLKGKIVLESKKGIFAALLLINDFGHAFLTISHECGVL